MTQPQKFMPPAGLGNPHAQTVFASTLMRRRHVAHAAADMRLLSEDVVVPCSDGARLLAHYSPATGKARTKQLVILIHGWEGSAESIYLLSATAKFHAAGYDVLRLNLRDHGDSHHLNEDLFHSCRLQEVFDAVVWASNHYQPERLVLGGFSLGANFCLRVAMRAAEYDLRPDRVLAVCPVLNPVQTMHALDNGWFVYRHYFIRKWRKSLMKKMQVFPEIYQFGELEKFRSLEAMTDYFVCHHTEYPDLLTYLNGYSLAGDGLNAIEADTHILLAADDPVIPVVGLEDLSYGDNVNVEVTAHGGHCGYLNNYRLDSWVDEWLLHNA